MSSHICIYRYLNHKANYSSKIIHAGRKIDKNKLVFPKIRFYFSIGPNKLFNKKNTKKHNKQS